MGADDERHLQTVRIRTKAEVLKAVEGN